MEAEIAKHCVPCVRDNLPGGRNQPSPFWRDEEHRDVYQTCQQPRKIREEVPVPPQTKVFVAGQGNPRWERGFLVASRPEPVVRPLLLRELEPCASRRAVIVPVKSRMCAQYLQPAPDQKREKKKVEEMRRPQPQWIIKKHLPELSTMFQLMTGQNGTVVLLK